MADRRQKKKEAWLKREEDRLAKLEEDYRLNLILQWPKKHERSDHHLCDVSKLGYYNRGPFESLKYPRYCSKKGHHCFL